LNILRPHVFILLQYVNNSDFELAVEFGQRTIQRTVFDEESGIYDLYLIGKCEAVSGVVSTID
jgi:hypothetical protein